MNNRQIKFRVWTPEHNKIIYPLNDVGHVKDLYSSCRHHTQPFIFEITLTGRIFVSRCCGERGFKDDYVLQQFTGLTDKNGKEIYEGDILKVNPYNSTGCIGYVRYLESIGAYSLGHPKNENYRFDLYLLDEPEQLPPGVTFSTVRTRKINRIRLEIIGNIFENPDLLNEQPTF